MSGEHSGDLCVTAINELDTMTGFYTHDETFRKIKEYIKGQGANGTHALLVVDINDLKSVNDFNGFEFGDKVIKECSKRITEHIKNDDICGRIGGDEFLVFIKNCDSKVVADESACALVDSLNFEYSADSSSYAVSSAIGVSIYGVDDTDIGNLYLKAEAALYYAKKNSNTNYALYGNEIKPEQIRAEEKESLIRLRTLLEYMDGGVILVDVGEDINVYYASPSFYKMSHRTTEEIGENGELLFSVVVPEDKGRLAEVAHRIAKTGETLDCVYRVYEINGEIGWRQIRAARLPGLNKNGNRSIICVITDVSELKESNATLETVVENSPAGIGIFEIDREGVKPTFYNQMMKELVGAGSEQLNSIIDFISSGDREDIVSEIIRCAYEGCPCEIEFEIIDVSGKKRFISARGVNLYEHNNKIYSLAIFSDITKEYVLRKQLDFEQKRYRTAVDLTKAVLWEVDIKKKTTYHYDVDPVDGSDAEVAVYENSPDSVIASGIIHPDFVDEYKRMYDNLYNGDDSGEYFYKRRDNGNGYIWVKSRFRVLKDENGDRYYSVGVAEKVLNIDSQMRRFEQEQYFCDQVSNSVLGSIKVNISKNLIERHFIASTTKKIQSNQHSYDDLLVRSVNMISVEEDQNNLMQKLSRENLFEVFRNGQDWINVEFRRKDKSDKIRWTSLAMSLHRHPVSGDLYGFAYVRDVDKRRKWELSLHSKVERDSISMVYSRATAFDMVNLMLSTVKNKQSYCAMCIIEIAGLDSVQADKGEYMVHNILFAMGRVLRIIVDGAAIVGQIDHNRVMIFRVGIGSPEEQFLRAEYSADRLATMLRITFPNENIDIYSSVVTACAQNANLHNIYERAYSSCAEAVKRNSKVVRIELEENTPASKSFENQNSDTDKNYDLQTGLLTRQHYYDAFRKLRPETLSSLGVLIADINGLRTINHRYGMEYGDQIIKQVAESIRTQFGEEEVFRVSGDEFLVLCKDSTQESFINRCDAVVELIGTSHQDIISVGVTWDSHVSDIQALIDHADELMKSAKQEYYRLNNTIPNGSDFKAYMWVTGAINDGKFYVYLQPKAELSSGKITGCEALVRYYDTESGLINPSKFIAVLERENVIKQLDFYVLRKSLDIIQSWINSGKTPIPVSVNFSRKTILAPNALEDVIELVKGREHLLEYICIEITETIGSMERAMITRVCEMFQKAGFRLALDDFGSEYSNLYIISALRFDEIKIDKSVIDDIVTNDLARLTVENTKRICERTGAILVAEGVETEEQMNILKSIGCHMVQGYHINKPLPLDEFSEKYIEKNTMQ